MLAIDNHDSNSLSGFVLIISLSSPPLDGFANLTRRFCPSLNCLACLCERYRVSVGRAGRKAQCLPDFVWE